MNLEKRIRSRILPICLVGLMALPLSGCRTAAGRAFARDIGRSYIEQAVVSSADKEFGKEPNQVNVYNNGQLNSAQGSSRITIRSWHDFNKNKIPDKGEVFGDVGEYPVYINNAGLYIKLLGTNSKNIRYVVFNSKNEIIGDKRAVSFFVREGNENTSGRYTIYAESNDGISASRDFQITK